MSATRRSLRSARTGRALIACRRIAVECACRGDEEVVTAARNLARRTSPCAPFSASRQPHERPLLTKAIRPCGPRAARGPTYERRLG